jgi:hypothetical protein
MPTTIPGYLNVVRSIHKAKSPTIYGTTEGWKAGHFSLPPAPCPKTCGLRPVPLPGGEMDGCRLGGHACFVTTARCESFIHSHQPGSDLKMERLGRL